MSRVLMFITYVLLYSFFDFPGYGDRCDAQDAEVNGRPKKGRLAQQIVLPVESLHPLAQTSSTHALTALIPQQISLVFTPSDHKETGQ